MMTEKAVINLLKTSKNESEWNTNCDIIKKICGGYPSFWWEKIMMSGLAASIEKTWPNRHPEGVEHTDDGITIFRLGFPNENH